MKKLLFIQALLVLCFILSVFIMYKHYESENSKTTTNFMAKEIGTTFSQLKEGDHLISDYIHLSTNGFDEDDVIELIKKTKKVKNTLKDLSGSSASIESLNEVLNALSTGNTKKASTLIETDFKDKLTVLKEVQISRLSDEAVER